MTVSNFEIATMMAAWVGALATVGAIIVAWKQLGRIANANQLAVLSSVLELEETIDRRRVRLSEAVSDLEAEKEREAKGEPNRLDLKQAKFEEAVESYLNAIDRLCASILRGLITETEYRRDYRPLVTEVMTAQQYKPYLGPGTIYRNIVKLHGKWADD